MAQEALSEHTVYLADFGHHTTLVARTFNSEENDTLEAISAPLAPFLKKQLLGRQSLPDRSNDGMQFLTIFCGDDSVSSHATTADSHSSPLRKTR